MANILENWSNEYPKFYKFLSEVGFLVFVVIIILIIFKIFAPIEKLDNDGLVIGFIGVLATFIVIGNFSQISRIENNIEADINNIKGRLTKCEEKSEKIKTMSETIELYNNRINSLEDKEESSKPLDKLDLARLLKLFVGKEGDIRKYMQLYAKMLDSDSFYHVELVNGKKMTIKINYDENIKDLKFIHSAEDEIEAQHIIKISGLTFNHDDLLFAYQLLRDIAVTDMDFNEDDKMPEEASETIEGNKSEQKEV